MPVEFRAYENNDLLRCITHPFISPSYCYLTVALATVNNITCYIIKIDKIKYLPVCKVGFTTWKCQNTHL